MSTRTRTLRLRLPDGQLIAKKRGDFTVWYRRGAIYFPPVPSRRRRLWDFLTGRRRRRRLPQLHVIGRPRMQPERVMVAEQRREPPREQDTAEQRKEPLRVGMVWCAVGIAATLLACSLALLAIGPLTVQRRFLMPSNRLFEISLNIAIIGSTKWQWTTKTTKRGNWLEMFLG